LSSPRLSSNSSNATAVSLRSRERGRRQVLGEYLRPHELDSVLIKSSTNLLGVRETNWPRCHPEPACDVTSLPKVGQQLPTCRIALCDHRADFVLFCGMGLKGDHARAG